MAYTVKEIFYTLQGEGFHTGRPAVFCRFTSCNLWTGREQDRHRAICQFCDTDFVGTNGVAALVVKSGDELKLVDPQEGGDPAQFEHLDFGSFRLSPMDGPATRENTAAAVEYCLKRPKWRLNLQTHKYLGIP